MKFYNSFKKNCFYIVISILSILFLMFLNLQAAQFEEDYYKDPLSIIKRINDTCAQSVVSELYSQDSKWNFVIKQIAKGTRSWLSVAVSLSLGSDAGASEMLVLAVGEALERRPDNVFAIALNRFQLEEICGGPDVDDFRYNSYELAVKAVNLRLKSISTINDPKFKKTCIKCSEFLKQAKADIARFFGKNEAN